MLSILHFVRNLNFIPYLQEDSICSEKSIRAASKEQKNYITSVRGIRYPLIFMDLAVDTHGSWNMDLVVSNRDCNNCNNQQYEGEQGKSTDGYY